MMSECVRKRQRLGYTSSVQMWYYTNGGAAEFNDRDSTVRTSSGGARNPLPINIQPK